MARHDGRKVESDQGVALSHCGKKGFFTDSPRYAGGVPRSLPPAQISAKLGTNDRIRLSKPAGESESVHVSTIAKVAQGFGLLEQIWNTLLDRCCRLPIRFQMQIRHIAI